MNQPSLRPALGNYADGDRFWDREREVHEITAYLADGQSVLLTGPRRVGKTSLVRRVLDGMSPPSRTLFLDVEKYADPTEMFAALGAMASADAGFWQRMRSWFGRRLGDSVERLEGIEFGLLKVDLQAAMGGSWRDDARAIIEALAEASPVTVVAVDELPLLVNRVMKRGPAEAELLVGTLRGLAGDFPAVRWMISGSIGLEPVLHRAGLTGMITHLRAYPVDAWNEVATTGAVEALARATDLTLEDGAANAVHDQLGLGVPYHVQLLMDELRRIADRRGDRHITVDDVIEVYGGPLVGSVRAHLLHLEARLPLVLGEGDALRLALDVLTQAAVVGVATSDDAAILAEDLVEDADLRGAILREVLEILEHDAYLTREADGWRFRSRLVRDWWKKSNELGFILAADRKPRS